MCQCVIELYLIDQGSSLLITVPSAFGILVQLWKVHKATKPALRRDAATGRLGLVFTRLEDEARELAAQREKAAAAAAAAAGGAGGAGGGGAAALAPPPPDTTALDRVAISHLSLALAPLTLGAAARSLLCEQHT